MAACASSSWAQTRGERDRNRHRRPRKNHLHGVSQRGCAHEQLGAVPAAAWAAASFVATRSSASISARERFALVGDSDPVEAMVWRGESRGCAEKALARYVKGQVP
jgi:hypothetical protein